MKISIEEIGKEMAELYRLTKQLNHADINADETDQDGACFELAAKEAENQIENLKQLLIFQRPETMREVLILALMAANHAEQMQPTPIHKLYPGAPTELRHNASVPINHSYDRYVEPVLRMLDAIIAGIEAHENISREELGLQSLRLREDDPKEMFATGLKGLAETKTESQKTNEAA